MIFEMYYVLHNLFALSQTLRYIFIYVLFRHLNDIEETSLSRQSDCQSDLYLGYMYR